MYNQEAAVSGMLGVVHDITEQVRTREALRANDSYGSPWECVRAAAPRGDATWNDSSGSVWVRPLALARDTLSRSGLLNAVGVPFLTAR